MEFKTGHTKRPKEIGDDGIVTFEHYTKVEGSDTIELTETTVTEDECKAHGFTWLPANDLFGDRCILKIEKTSKHIDFNKNRTNLILGANHHIPRDTENSVIIGSKISIGSNTNYNIASGFRGEINDSINSSFLEGSKGNVTVSNQHVQGCNQIADILGERQYTRVMFGVQSVQGSTIDSYLNNDGSSFYPIPENSAMYFNASILAVRVGTTGGGEVSGNIGDFGSWLERGVIINRDGTLEISRTRKEMETSGTTTDWRATAALDGTNFKITVRGEDNCTLEWAATIDFTEIRTLVDLSTGR